MSEAKDMYTGEETFNWDEISDEAPPPLADGFYFATFAKTDFQKAKSGKPGVKIEFTVTKAYGGADGELKRKLFDNPVFSQESAFRLKRLAKSAGVELPSVVNRETIEEFCGNLQSSSGVWIRTKQNTYEGKVSARVDQYFSEAQIADAVAGKTAGVAEAAPVAGKRRRS